MKLAIIGSRSFANYALLDDTIMKYFLNHSVIHGEDIDPYVFDEIVSGGAKGADSLGAEFAKKNNIKLTEFLPDYKKNGKDAPLIRNIDIVHASDFVLAFWDGKSTGTGHTLFNARHAKKNTLIIYF